LRAHAAIDMHAECGLQDHRRAARGYFFCARARFSSSPAGMVNLPVAVS
jgi:hypothetical protein